MYIGKGFQDYLSKPVNPEKLLEKLKMYIPAECVEGQCSEEESREEIKKKLPQIIMAMDDYDSQVAKEILTELSHNRYPEEILNILCKAASRIECFEFEEAKQILETIVK